MIGYPSRITATGQLKTGAGALLGFYVSSTSTGTLTLYDNTTAAGTQISGVITPAVGWHALPARFAAGLHAVIANSLDVTFVLR